MRVIKSIIAIITAFVLSLLPITAYAETGEANKIDLFLGDSTTSAIGVSDTQRWSKLFSEKDNAQEVNMQLEVPAGGTQNGCMMAEHMLINMKKLVMR